MFTIFQRILQETIMLDEEFYKQADKNQQYFLKHHGYTTKTADLPESFTFNKTILSYAQKDQGSCGSCYQTATIQSFEERWYLKSGQGIHFSIQYGLGCDNGTYGGVTNNGCKGGNSIISYRFLVSNGAPTEQCMPYTSYSATYPWKDVACQSVCVDGSKPKFYKASSYRRVSGVENIKKEIYENGPVAASMYLYSDFNSQVANGGIFQQTSGSTRQGGHAVVIVGWGIQNNIKYWYVQNTYGKSWNGDGFFKIRMGHNDATIESYVVCGDPDVEKQDTVEEGKFINTDYVLLNNQQVTISYQNMQSCTLYLNNVRLGTISGNGSMSTKLSTTSSIINATCGSVVQQYKVANFTPQLTNTQLQATVNETYRFTFLSNSLVQQNLIIGSTTYNVQSSGQYDYKFTTTGQYTVKIVTSNTIPQLQDQITVTSIKSQDDQYAKFSTQPEDILLGETSQSSVTVKGVSKIKAYLYKDNTQISFFSEIWITSTAEKTYQLTVKPDEIGVYYIKIAADEIIVNSKTFTVSQQTQQEEIQIISPQNQSISLNTQNINIKTKYGANQIVYLNKQNIGTVGNNEEFLVQSNKLQLGINNITIGDVQLQLIIIQQPKFEQSQYNGYINEQLIINILPNDIDYSKYYTLYINNSMQTFSNNQIKIKQSTIGQFIVKLQSIPSFITENQVTVSVVINNKQDSEQQCVIQVPQKNDYMVNVSYSYTTSCSGQHYLVYQNTTKQLESNNQFKALKIGNYMICTDQQCSNIFQVHGIILKLNQTNINTINQVVQLQYQVYSDFTDYLYLQYYCKDTNDMQTIQYIDRATDRTLQWIMPNVQTCNQAKFRLVNYKYNLYGDSDTVTINQQVLPSNSLFNPFEKDPVFDIQPQFNITNPPIEEEEQEQENHPVDEDVPVVFTYPTVNQRIKAGSKITIKWVSNLKSSLSATIILYKKGGTLVKTYTRSAPNNGQYELEVPNSENGEYYFYIRIVEGSEKHIDSVDVIIY